MGEICGIVTVPSHGAGVVIVIGKHGGFLYGLQTIVVDVLEHAGKQICVLVEPFTPFTVTLPPTG